MRYPSFFQSIRSGRREYLHPKPSLSSRSVHNINPDNFLEELFYFTEEMSKVSVSVAISIIKRWWDRFGIHHSLSPAPALEPENAQYYLTADQAVETIDLTIESLYYSDDRTEAALDKAMQINEETAESIRRERNARGNPVLALNNILTSAQFLWSMAVYGGHNINENQRIKALIGASFADALIDGIISPLHYYYSYEEIYESNHRDFIGIRTALIDSLILEPALRHGLIYYELYDRFYLQTDIVIELPAEEDSFAAFRSQTDNELIDLFPVTDLILHRFDTMRAEAEAVMAISEKQHRSQLSGYCSF